MSNTMNRAGDVVAQPVDPDIFCDGQSRKSVPGRTVYTTQSSYTRVTIPWFALPAHSDSVSVPGPVSSW
jgi:hypothetical protein